MILYDENLVFCDVLSVVANSADKMPDGNKNVGD